jgi:hypothetical protein
MHGRMVVPSSLHLIIVFVFYHVSFVNGLSLNRRRILWLISCKGVMPVMTIPAASNGACLQGDLTPSCIGVYKVPIDDNIKEMILTKEALQKYAPGINYVPPIQPPTSLKSAYDIILAQRLAADDISVAVAAGRLEEAGIKVLNLIPRLAVSGRMLVDNGDFVDTSAPENIQYIRRQQVQNLFETTEVAWKNVDILMGQGIRGDLGVSAVAQIQILAELRDSTAAFDDFLATLKRR